MTAYSESDRLAELVAAHPRLFACLLPMGWQSLIQDLCTQLEAELASDERFFFVQIKEKLGRLRIRYRGPVRVSMLLDDVIQASRQRCATCGREVPEPASENAIPSCAEHEQ